MGIDFLLSLGVDFHRNFADCLFGLLFLLLGGLGVR